MGLKLFKPTSPGRRGGSCSDFAEITTSKPEKSLLRPLKKTGGRNNTGRMTQRRRGGGHKRMYRVIDFKRRKDAIPAKVASIEYDPNRSCRIALLHYVDGEKRYILAPLGVQVGQILMNGPTAEGRAAKGSRKSAVYKSNTDDATEQAPEGPEGSNPALPRRLKQTLKLLKKRGPRGVTKLDAPKYLALALSAHIHQLRRRGFEIVTLRESRGDSWIGRYVLVRELDE